MMTDTINTRELIMNILLEMDREKTPCHLAVRDALDKYQFLPRQDRAFIKRVCGEPWNTVSRMTTSSISIPKSRSTNASR